MTRLEEEQARNRSADDDSKLFTETCDLVRAKLAEMLDLKLKKKGAAAAEMQELRVQATLAVVTLKKLNRLDKLRTKDSR